MFLKFFVFVSLECNNLSLEIQFDIKNEVIYSKNKSLKTSWAWVILDSGEKKWSYFN